MLIKNRMHSKNIYKKPPNFKELAIKFPEFRKYVKQDLSGRITINYQDQKALKELSRTLLKQDFDLNVEIDETRLIPRVPLCLNYILWIEDLLGALEPSERKPLGIDIGTGNVCIYSLLGARKGWKMYATEMDPFNYKNAVTNVNKNNLNDLISVKLVENHNQILLGAIDENLNYDFCMCNPPFFDYNEKPVNRTFRRPQVDAVASNVKTEVCSEGGEISFISKLIEESVKLKTKIKIYTTLVGKKSDFLYLKKVLMKISPNSLTFTEFCQGKTTRWCLAWSFLNISLNNVSNSLGSNRKRKSKHFFNFTIPHYSSKEINDVFTITAEVLNQLQVT